MACFNVFGYEDASAVTNAARGLDLPVILAANKDLIDYMGVAASARLLCAVAEASPTPVCVHLDHCYEEAIVYRALKEGFSSVMFDGSQLPLEENIRRTRQVVEVAHACGATVEGEIGSVPYHTGRDHIRSEHTDPEQARTFAAGSGVDAVAVSIGNVHRLENTDSKIDYERLAEIEAVVEQPLVLHGVTGIREPDLQRLRRTRIAKCNVGTSLRMAFGNALRESMQAHPDQYDRLFFFQRIQPVLEDEARSKLRLLTAKGD